MPTKTEVIAKVRLIRIAFAQAVNPLLERQFLAAEFAVVFLSSKPPALSNRPDSLTQWVYNKSNAVIESELGSRLSDLFEQWVRNLPATADLTIVCADDPVPVAAGAPLLPAPVGDDLQRYQMEIARMAQENAMLRQTIDTVSKNAASAIDNVTANAQRMLDAERAAAREREEEALRARMEENRAAQAEIEAEAERRVIEATDRFRMLQMAAPVRAHLPLPAPPRQMAAPVRALLPLPAPPRDEDRRDDTRRGWRSRDDDDDYDTEPRRARKDRSRSRDRKDRSRSRDRKDRSSHSGESGTAKTEPSVFDAIADAARRSCLFPLVFRSKDKP
jgi:hypothetical protein